MKAYLLAGGLGERLRPLTLTMPKCLVPICGAPRPKGGQPVAAGRMTPARRAGVRDRFTP